MVVAKEREKTEVHKVYSVDELQNLLFVMGFPVHISRPYVDDGSVHSHFVRNTCTSIPKLWDEIVDPNVGELWVTKAHNEGQN